MLLGRALPLTDQILKGIRVLQIELFQRLITIPILLALILDLKYCCAKKIELIVHETHGRRFNL